MVGPPASFRIAGNCIAAAFLIWTAFASPPLRAQQADAPQAQGQGDQNALANRMTQLEEQIVDLQVVIGTLQSLARRQYVGGDYPPAAAPLPPPGQSDPASLPAGATPSDVGMRVTVIETQIQALTGQIEQFSQQLQRLQAAGGAGGFGMEAGSPPLADPPASPPDDNLGRLLR
jgi:TolA-binding protein